MKNIDIFKIIKNRLKLKYNIFLGFFLIFIFTIIFLSLTIYNFYTKTFNDVMNNDIDYRRYTVSNIGDRVDKEIDYEYLKNIPNIEAIYNPKLTGVEYLDNVSLFKVKGHPGDIHLTPIITSDDIVTTNKLKLNPNESGYAICPEKMYPTSGIIDSVDYFKILNGKDFIGEYFTVLGKKFKVIDTYNSDIYYKEKDTCLISSKDFAKIRDYKSLNNSNDNTSVNIQIDDYKNVNSVLEILHKDGFKTHGMVTIIYDEINSIKSMTMIIFFVTFILTIVIASIIIIKKNKAINNYYSLLKNLGYNNKLIKKISCLELLMILIISAIIGFIIYYILKLIMAYIIMPEIILKYRGFDIPYLLFIINILILIFYFVLVNTNNLNKYLEK